MILLLQPHGARPQSLLLYVDSMEMRIQLREGAVQVPQRRLPCFRDLHPRWDGGDATLLDLSMPFEGDGAVTTVAALMGTSTVAEMEVGTAWHGNGGGDGRGAVGSPPQPWKPSRQPQVPPLEPLIAGGAVRRIVLPRAAAKAHEAGQSATAAGMRPRLISGKELAMLSETTWYMTQEEAAKHVEDVLAALRPSKPTKCERSAQWRAGGEQWRADGHPQWRAGGRAEKTPASQWIRFIWKSHHAEIGEPVQIVGVSKSGKTLRTAHGGSCLLTDVGRVWEYCDPPAS